MFTVALGKLVAGQDAVLGSLGPILDEDSLGPRASALSHAVQEAMPAAQTDGAMPSKSSVEPPPPSASTSSVSHDFLAGWCEQRRFEVQEVIGKGSYGVVCAGVFAS